MVIQSEIPRLAEIMTWVLRATESVQRWYYELSRESEREARGLRLLKEWLFSKQLAQYEAEKYFDVVGCASGKKYRICHGRGNNVQELDEAGRPNAGWCFVPRDCLVVGDILLAQKIALETNELGALEVASTFPISWSAR